MVAGAFSDSLCAQEAVLAKPPRDDIHLSMRLPVSVQLVLHCHVADGWTESMSLAHVKPKLLLANSVH